MSWLKALVKLTELHRVREEMSYRSLYHGVYQAEAIALNAVILAGSGKNYADFTQQEIADLTIDAMLLSES